eukprot:scaffold14777_cov118-Isochrysis_galbana.AAC.3
MGHGQANLDSLECVEYAFIPVRGGSYTREWSITAFDTIGLWQPLHHRIQPLLRERPFPPTPLVGERVVDQLLEVELAPTAQADRAPLGVVLQRQNDMLIGLAVDRRLEADGNAFQVPQPLRQVRCEKHGFDALDRQCLPGDVARSLHDAAHRPLLAHVEVVDAREVVGQFLDVRLHSLYLGSHWPRC